MYLGGSPANPNQVTLNRDGSIDIKVCAQKSLTISDPSVGSTLASFNAFTGNSIGGGDTRFTGQVYFDGNTQIGGTAATSGLLEIARTLTDVGTTGNVTINKLSGTVNIAAGAGTAGVTVTNSLVNANSIVYAVARTNDATCSVKNVVPGAGSFVLRTTDNCTAETSFGFLVTN